MATAQTIFALKFVGTVSLGIATVSQLHRHLGRHDPHEMLWWKEGAVLRISVI